jgi:membrane protease YdiL (CAAX protease family)
MLKLYTTVAGTLALVMGWTTVVVTAYNHPADPARVYWLHGLDLAVVLFVVLLIVGYPIIIAGRIGERRNRRGYLAGILFGWLGLLYILVRQPRTSGPDWISRAVMDYRGSGVE